MVEDIVKIITSVNNFRKMIDDKVGGFLGDIQKDIDKLNSIANNAVGKSQRAVQKELERTYQKIKSKEAEADRWVADKCAEVEKWAADQVKSIQDSAKEEKAKKLAQVMATAQEIDVDDKMMDAAMKMVPDVPIPIPSVPKPQIPWPEIPMDGLMSEVNAVPQIQIPPSTINQAMSKAEVATDAISAGSKILDDKIK